MDVVSNEDILLEVLKHLDARSLGVAACVNKQWKNAAEMEIVWEGVCSKHWPVAQYSQRSVHEQMRGVVLALGGYRRLFLLCLRPLIISSRASPTKYPNSSSSSSSETDGTSNKLSCPQWGKDEVQLSLSLFSIDCYERLGNLSESSSLLFLCKPSAQTKMKAKLHSLYRSDY
eukprot:Gb_08961 [translate_table: standard]